MAQAAYRLVVCSVLSATNFRFLFGTKRSRRRARAPQFDGAVVSSFFRVYLFILFILFIRAFGADAMLNVRVPKIGFLEMEFGLRNSDIPNTGLDCPQAEPRFQGTFLGEPRVARRLLISANLGPLEAGQI